MFQNCKSQVKILNSEMKILKLFIEVLKWLFIHP